LVEASRSNGLLDHRQEHLSPVFGARFVAAPEHLVAAPEHRALQFTELVKQTLRLVAEALAVPLVSSALLLAIGFAHGTVHLEDQFTKRLVLMRLVNPLARRVHQRCQVAAPGEYFGLEAGAACSCPSENQSAALRSLA